MKEGYEDFVKAVDDFCLDAFGVIPYREDRQDQYKAFWEKLGLGEYTQRLYIIVRDDVLNQAEEMEIDLSEHKDDETFWGMVQEYIEEGMELDWYVVVREAIRASLDGRE